MPNGFYGPKAIWDRMEEPLRNIDPVLKLFAAETGLQLSKNYHNWPERSFRWNESELHKLIQIYLDDETKLTFTFWICAFEDRSTQRYSKRQKLVEGLAGHDLPEKLDALLAEGKATLDTWKESNLESPSQGVVR